MSAPLRSLLFAPANHPRRVEKALSLPADAVILDLEDAVAAAEKPAARAAALAAAGRPRRTRLYVRVNAMSTEWALDDLLGIAAPGVDGIVLPKVESADQLRCADWILGASERARGMAPGAIDLVPIIETAAGIARLSEIAGAGTRTRRIAFGAGDFTLDAGLAWTREETELLPARMACTIHSRAAGLDPPLDTVWADLSDAEGMRRSAERARDLGFQGKMCIHPDQLGAANAAFTPAQARVAEARRIVAAFAEAEAAGIASIQLDGKFIDYPIAHAARRIVAIAESIAAREAAP